MQTKIARFQGLLVLSAGIALSAYALFMMTDLAASARSVLMLGSQYGQRGIVSERIVAGLLIAVLGLAGLALIAVAVKMIIKASKE